MPVGVKDVRAPWVARRLCSVLIPVPGSRRRWTCGRLDESVCKSSPDLQEIFPCVASINPHLLCHISLHVPCVCFPLWLSAPVCAVVPPYLRLLVSHFLAVIAVGNNNLRKNKNKSKNMRADVKSLLHLAAFVTVCCSMCMIL